MKLAIAQNNTQVHAFFGSCNTFLIATIDNGKVIATESVYNDTQTHKLRPAYLKSLGVSALIIKGLGLTAYELLNQNGITVYACETIDVDDALKHFLANQLPIMVAPDGAHC